MIEKTYIVFSVESFLDGVMMFLKPTDIPDMPRMEPVAPGGDTEEVRLAKQMSHAMIMTIKNEMPGIPVRPKFSVFMIGVYLSLTEYEELGKPTVNDTIKMQLEIRKETQ